MNVAARRSHWLAGTLARLGSLGAAVLVGFTLWAGLACPLASWAAVSGSAAETRYSLNLTTAFPAAGATNVCPDTPLRLEFAAPPALGPNGRIQIYRATDHTAVETIDISSPTATKTIGGLPNFNYHPVIIRGNEVMIFPKNGALGFHETYYVTIDPGVFRDAAGDYNGIDQPAMWRFSTKAAAPAAGTARLTVAADGRGDFCTVQGALDFIPDRNTAPTTIFVRKGTYTELVFFTNKHAITMLGEDRRETVIAYANNARFNDNSGNPYTTGGTFNPGGNIYRRGVFLAHEVENLAIANLTIRNTTPQGGSQAEAIILNGTPTARAIIANVDLYSYQDTLQINGQAYVSGCHIEGDVDFMWGRGPCFFESCVCRTLRSDVYYTQIRNPGTNHGFVYLNCTFDGSAGVTGNFLSRIEPHRFPASEVVLLDCVLGRAVGPVGWQLQGGDPAPGVHFWEFNSHDADGRPIDLRLRLAVSKELREPVDAATIANYRNPAWVLGDDWNPKAAPIFPALAPD